MFKYGDIININTGISKTMLPRNLTFNKSINNNTITNIISSTTSSQITNSLNFATITDLTVSSISLISDTIFTNIFISSPIAFSVLKSDYQINDFSIYPIYFSQNININNKIFNLESNHVSIKDNVLLINSQNIKQSIVDNQLDNIISGFIFPIADQDTTTGFYCGLLYVPNNRLNKISNNSIFYKWSELQYNYFVNNKKGFFKLKYLPQNLDFSIYANKMDNTYYNFINNYSDLANLQSNSIGLYDGEIVGMNNNIIINTSDGNNIINIIQFNNNFIKIFNNLPIIFNSILSFIDNNNNNYVTLKNNLIEFANNIVLNQTDHIINFNNTISFNNNNEPLLKLTSGINKKVELFGTVLINNLQILNNFELNNIPLVFTNSLSFVGNNNLFITLDAVNNNIILFQPTSSTKLSINDKFTINNDIPIEFNRLLNIQDVYGINFINFNSLQHLITTFVPVFIDNITITNLFNLHTDIIINNDVSIKNYNNNIITFNNNNTIVHNNLLLENNIIYNTNIKIVDISNNINMIFDDSISIIKNNSVYFDISNIIVNSIFNLSNTSFMLNNLTFTPISKLYIVSGKTNINSTYIFTLKNVLKLNNFSGKIMGTTWGLNNTNINAYDINIWSYQFINSNGNPDYNVGYNTLNPINTNNNGDWNISNIAVQLDYDGIYDLNIYCNGSTYDKIIWGLKVDILQI